MGTAPLKANAVDYTNEGRYRDLKDQTTPNACLNQVKLFRPWYGAFILVLSLHSAHKQPRTSFLQSCSYNRFMKAANWRPQGDEFIGDDNGGGVVSRIINLLAPDKCSCFLWI